MLRTSVVLFATALSASASLAAPVQLQLEYTNIQFRFSPSSDFSSDNASGFLFPGDGMIYNEFITPEDRANLRRAVDRELQSIFDNQGITNGGAVFDSSVNEWVLQQQYNPVASVGIHLSFDPNDFTKSNVIGTGANNEPTVINTYNGPINVSLKNSAGAIIETHQFFDNYVTGAGQGVSLGDGQTGDLIAMGSYEMNPEPHVYQRDLGLYFGNLQPRGGNWFDALAADANALEHALNTDGFTRIFEYEEYLTGTFIDQFGATRTEQHGVLMVQGQLRSSIVATGENEAAPLLPDTTTVSDAGTPTYNFAVDIPADSLDPIWIDPDIAVGYTYTIENAAGVAQAIAGVQAPTLASVNDTTGYTITFMAGGVEYSVDINAGERLLFADVPGVSGIVTEFTLSGIDEHLMLNPEDPTLFRTGIFAGAGVSGAVTLTQTPITKYIPDPTSPAPVPLPLPALMLLSGLAGLGLLRRKSA